MPARTVRNWIALSCLTLLITACGGGSGGGNSASNGATNSSTSASGSASSPASGSTGTTAPTPALITYPIQLAWTAPSTRADGSALTASELNGYRIYYSLEGSSSSADTILTVNGGSTTALKITLTAAGTYAFAITAIDQNGLESSLSSPVLVAVN
jgi:hypothetical protein